MMCETKFANHSESSSSFCFINVKTGSYADFGLGIAIQFCFLVADLSVGTNFSSAPLFFGNPSEVDEE